MFTLMMTIEDEHTQSKIEQIYRLYRKQLYFTAYDILKDYHEAEDVVQSAIVKIYSQIDKIDDIQCNKTRGFLVIIVRNLAFNIYNMRKKSINFDIEKQKTFSMKMSRLIPEQHVIKIDNAEWVARKLAQINPEYADVLVFRYTYQLSSEEIADLLNISESNVRVRLHRARKALQEIMKGDYYDRTGE